jgi:acyl-coenzyme A synthetase/AMP-(fatty) acid ligase
MLYGRASRSHSFASPHTMPHRLPDRLNIARHCLTEQAQLRPDKTALIIVGDGGGERRWSYAQLDEQVRRLAGGLLAAGTQPGDRLMIRMDNDLPYLLTFFAGFAAGLVSFPSSASLTAEEAEFLLTDSGATLLALSDDLALAHAPPASVRVLTEAEIGHLAEAGPLLDPRDTAADDPAFLIYTSGTTGRPKGVLHGHRVIWGRRPMVTGWYGLTSDDVVLHAGAFNWTYTLGVGLLDPWAHGATAVLYNGTPDPALWPELIARFGVTLFATVPSLYRRILKYGDASPEKLATLRHGLSAGEALAPALLEAWQARTGTALYEALGMSEISTYISTGPGMAIKPGSPGKPQAGRRVAILDPDAPATEPRLLPAGQVGLLAVHRSDPGLMLGYWNRPEEELLVMRGPWFTGGDLAHLDEDGYLWFHGRNDDLLNTHGYRLSPLEIERVLAQHPDIADVAVGEVSVAADLTVLSAFVVPHHPTREAAILDWAKEHLASYKQPRRVIFLDRLPRTPNGKLLRRALPSGS